jgi:predicted membrane channel-forming protein YqfA (hemolysin III family)
MTQTVFNTVYLVLGIALTGYGAWMVLFTGRVFLEEAFQRNKELVRVISHVLTVSFCLVMCGYLLMAAEFVPPQGNGSFVWNVEFIHFGAMVLFMGVDLFFHLLVLSQMRGRGRRRPEHGASILA